MTTEAIRAAEQARAFIRNLRVPQTTAAAGLQVWQGGAVLDALDAVLTPTPPVASEET